MIANRIRLKVFNRLTTTGQALYTPSKGHPLEAKKQAFYDFDEL